MKHRLPRIAAVLLTVSLAIGAAGCAKQIEEAKGFVTGVKNAVTTVTQTSVEPQKVYVAINAFDAAKATATNYLRQPRCSPTSPVLCRDPAATKIVIKAVRAGTEARNKAKAFLRANPGQPLAIKTYDDLLAAKDVVTSIVGTYKAN